jgi:membrane associated rhomboid family serine protease
MSKDKEKRSGKRKFFLFVFFAGLIAAIAAFFKRRRGQGIEESEWQELPPPEGG